MLEFHTILVIVVHYSYDAVMEFITNVGDHFISHYFVVFTPGAVHCFVFVVKRVRRKRAVKAGTFVKPTE